MASLLSFALKQHPLLSAISMVTVFEIPSALLSHYSPTVFPIEYADVYSIILAFVLTLLYYAHSARTLRQSLLCMCVTLWAFRLSTFLAARVRAGFRDARLNRFRGSPKRAVRWGFAQTLWITVTLLPIWVSMSDSITDSSLNVLDIFALVCFGAGLVLELMADAQKAAFIQVNHARPEAVRKPACDIGLFKYSRFPNYFGEWTIWTAISLLAWQSTSGWKRLFLPLCSWFVLKIFYSLSIPLAIKAMKKRATERQFAEWCGISMFVPLPPGRKI